MDALKKLPVIISIALLLLCAAVGAYAYTETVNVLLDNNCSGGAIDGSVMTLTDASGSNTQLSGAYNATDGGDFVVIGTKRFAMPLVISSNQPISWKGVLYHGDLLFKKASGGLCVSNSVDVETYLRGVVPIEMNKNWPQEALKAQAVLARTYVAASGKHGGYNVCDEGHCQIYRGVTAESKNVDSAIAATAGMLLLWQGRPASVYYHSDSGGMVTGAESVWGGKLPYLCPVAEPIASKGPNAHWQAELPMSLVESKLASGGISVGSISSITPLARDATGRVLTLEIQGQVGKKNISGYRFRSLVGAGTIKSTLFEFETRSDYAPAFTAQNQSASVPTPIDLSEMPTDKEEQLVWLTKKKIFTTKELMEMLSRPEMADSYIKTGIARAEGREPLPQTAPVQSATAPALETYKANLSMTPAAGPVVRIFGRGFGHGVGLSQWGAKTLAESGWDYTKILGLYFPGTTTGQ